MQLLIKDELYDVLNNPIRWIYKKNGSDNNGYVSKERNEKNKKWTRTQKVYHRRTSTGKERLI